MMKDVDLCLKWYGQVDITSKAIDETRFVRFFVVVGTNCLIVRVRMERSLLERFGWLSWAILALLACSDHKTGYSLPSASATCLRVHLQWAHLIRRAPATRRLLLVIPLALLPNDPPIGREGKTRVKTCKAPPFGAKIFVSAMEKGRRKTARYVRVIALLRAQCTSLVIPRGKN